MPYKVLDSDAYENFADAAIRPEVILKDRV